MIARLPSDALTTLLEVSDDAIIGVDNEGLVDAWNPAATRLLGWSEEEAVGSPLPLGALPRLEPGLWKVQAQRRDRTAVHVEVRASRRASGGWLILASDRSLLMQRERAASERLRNE